MHAGAQRVVGLRRVIVLRRGDHEDIAILHRLFEVAIDLAAIFRLELGARRRQRVVDTAEDDAAVGFA